MQTDIINGNELSTYELAIYANLIVQHVSRRYSEFTNIAKLHRVTGCRIGEIFDPDRWNLDEFGIIRIKCEKGSLTRTHHAKELLIYTPHDFKLITQDMARLSKFQYCRLFADAVKSCNLYRSYVAGLGSFSTHFFRHVKVKELNKSGMEIDQIANYIGEAKIANVKFYLNSRFYD